MAGRRYAILIASSRFPEEPRLEDLRLPENDVDGLNTVLSLEGRGGFTDLVILKNRPSSEVLRNLNYALSRAERDDLVLIYYSGHGKLNRAGQLHLATIDTALDALESTSVPVQAIKSFIDVSPSNKVILILDCCYSGAIGTVFMRSGTDDQLQLMSSGRGTYIMTASTGIQVAVEKEGDQYGVFTKQVIEGIQGDEADADGDGYITMDELYGYVRRRIREEGAQEPMRWNLNGSGGGLVISRSGRVPWMERRDRIRDRVHTLAQQGALPNFITLKALEVTSLSPDQLTGELKRYDVLLDQLIRTDVRVGDFVDQWYRVALTTPSAEAQSQDQSPVTKDRREEAHRRYYIGAQPVNGIVFYGSIAAGIVLLLAFTVMVWEVVRGYYLEGITLQVKEDAQLGPIVTDGGMTLYMLSADQPDQSTCYDACAENWPPVTINRPPVTIAFDPEVGEQVNMTLIGIIQRNTGENQLTYNGRPLYYHAADVEPGDVQGHRVEAGEGLWTAITPEGEPVGVVPISAPTPEPTATPVPTPTGQALPSHIFLEAIPKFSI